MIGVTTVRQGPLVSTVNGIADAEAQSVASCSAGERMLGGGARIDVSPSSTTDNWKRIIMRDSYPSSASSWTAVVRILVILNDSSDRARVQAFVICGS